MSINSLKKIVLLGPQGSGKGTQAKVIADFLKVPIISSQILTEVVATQSVLGKKIERLMKQGELIPDEQMINLILDKLTSPACSSGFVLDGFPRNLVQAQALDNNSRVDVVFNIEISDEEAIRRIHGRRVCSNGHIFHLEFNPPKEDGLCDVCQQALYQRKDDEQEAVKRRLSIYHQTTTQLLGYYKQQGKLVIFDGEKSIPIVSKNILDYLKKNAG
jgi:adenylate kinase